MADSKPMTKAAARKLIAAEAAQVLDDFFGHRLEPWWNNTLRDAGVAVTPENMKRLASAAAELTNMVENRGQ